MAVNMTIIRKNPKIATFASKRIKKCVRIRLDEILRLDA
jgi:hypothetical protein